MSGFSNSTATTSLPASYYQNPRGTGAGNYGTSIDSGEATTGTQLLTTNNWIIASVALTIGNVIGTLNWVVGATNPGVATRAYLGLFDSSGNMLALTADFSSTLNGAGTNAPLNIPIATVASGAATSYTVPATGLYYLGVLVTSATLPTTIHANVNANITSLTPFRSGRQLATVLPPAFPYQILFGSLTPTAYVPFLYATA